MNPTKTLKDILHTQRKKYQNLKNHKLITSSLLSTLSSNRLVFNTKSTTSSLSICVIYLLQSTTLTCQCIKMEWIDAELQTHSGPYSISYLPAQKFRYYNQKYKINKVYKVTEFSEPNTIFSEEEYDSLGFLTSRYGMGSEGTIDFHRYYYSKDHYTVIDTIKHLVYQHEYDTANKNAVKSTKIDTIIRVQKSIYNSSDNLIAFYNKFFITDWSLQDYLGFHPDSLFYYYNVCGNRDSVVWYENRTREQANLEFGSQHGLKDKGEFMFPLYCGRFGQEIWWFDLDKKFVGLNRYGYSIRIKYRKSRILQCEEVFQDDYAGHIGQIKKKKLVTQYKYRGKSLIKVQGSLINNKANREKVRTIKLKSYKNGLPQINLKGHTLRYSYKLN